MEIRKHRCDRNPILLEMFRTDFRARKSYGKFSHDFSVREKIAQKFPKPYGSGTNRTQDFSAQPCHSFFLLCRYIEQGQIRVGPDVVRNPALHVTRDMEDHITWADGSKILRHIHTANEDLDDFDLLVE